LYYFQRSSAQKLSGGHNMSRTRQEITCIFVDIQDSSYKTSRLDYQNVIDIMADFLTETSLILTEHNVKVGAYLGDGLMAFCDAKDSQKRVIDAAYKILEMREKKDIFYKKNWRSSFNICIGVQTGFASLGYFPCKEFGHYTAMGDTVNLASRFCSLAETNSICADQGFYLEIKGAITNFKLTPKTSQNSIKGYEGEQFNLIHATPKLYNEPSHDLCPNCSGVIETTSLFDEYEIRKCIVCDFGKLAPVTCPIERPSPPEKSDALFVSPSMVEQSESAVNWKFH
jgi:class 3 adenylate cyclase